MLAILVLVSFGFTVKGCPPQENIAPFCKCRVIDDDAYLYCDNFLSPQDLIAPLRTISMSNQKIFALSINNSSLQYIPHDVFHGCHIEKIRFVTTQILSLSDSEFAFEGLEDSMTELRATDAHYIANWDWSSLRKLQKLDLIDVNYISMGSLDEPFPHLPLVKALGITHAEISYIVDNVFSELPKLQILNMKDNDITELKRNMFPDPAENLAILDFSGNHLTSLPEDFFSNMPVLQTIDLNRNDFVTLSENPFRALFDSVADLFMNDNPFRCDCRMRWLAGKRFPFNFNAVCAAPAVLKGVKIKLLDLKSLYC